MLCPIYHLDRLVALDKACIVGDPSDAFGHFVDFEVVPPSVLGLALGQANFVGVW